MMLASVLGAADYEVATSGTDDASGAPGTPFRTIQKAADIMQPGDTCTVRAGIYREWVKPPRGGSGETMRITYRAAPGETVVISGAERITAWTHRGDGVWTATLPKNFFGGTNPYATTISGEWLHFGREYHLGAVYCDGLPLREVMTRDAVAAQPLSWHCQVADSVTTITVNPGEVDPNARLTEIAVRPCVFFPVVQGLAYITVDGFTIAQAACQWVYWRVPQQAALGTYFGFRWRIQDCLVTDATCVGIACGNEASGENEGFDMASVGQHVVRNNHIRRCGEAGIHGYKGWAGSRIEGNLIEDINVGNRFGGEESGGIKIHLPIDVTIAGNVIRRVHGHKPANYQGGKSLQFTGIWMDWAAQGTRVTGNVVYDTEAWSIFLQNVHGSPLLVDTNIVDRHIILHGRGAVFAHNLFVRSPWSLWGGDVVAYWEPHSARRAGIAVAAAGDVQWWNNVLVGVGGERFPHHPGYRADHNVFYAGAAKTPWGDTNSVVSAHDPGVRFTSLPDGVEVAFTADDALHAVVCPRIDRERVGVFALTGQGLDHPDGRPLAIDRDITGAPRDAAHPSAGPFEDVRPGANFLRVHAGRSTTRTPLPQLP